MATGAVRRWWFRLATGAVGVFAVMQLWQPARTNPASDPALALDRQVQLPPEVGALIPRSCGDCHTNATTWPWYAHVAPVSWLVVSDVDSGRQHLNLSQIGKLSPDKIGRRLRA